MIQILAAINFRSVIKVYVLNSFPKPINHVWLGKQSLKDFSRGKWQAFWQISNHVIKLMISIMVILLFTRKRNHSSMHQYNKTYCPHQILSRLAPMGKQRQELSYTEVTIIISQQGLQNATDCIFIYRLSQFILVVF